MDRDSLDRLVERHVKEGRGLYDMPRDKLQSRHEPKMRMSGSEHFDLDQHTFARLLVLHLADYCEGYSSNQNYRGGVRYIRHSVRGTPGFFTRGGVVGLPS